MLLQVDNEDGHFELKVGLGKPGYFVDLEPNGAGVKCIWGEMNQLLLNHFQLKFAQLFINNYDEDILENDQALADFIQTPLLFPYGRNRYTSLVECFPTDTTNEKPSSLRTFRAVLLSDQMSDQLSDQMKKMGFGFKLE